MTDTIHTAVMTDEVLDALKPRAGGVYIDATLGGATHTETLLQASGPNGRVLSLDLDPRALERAHARLRNYGDRWIGVEANFRHLANVVSDNGCQPCDGILFDLGLSSDELQDPVRGFSFQVDGPLDMRLGPRANEDGLTAADIVNTWSQEELERLLLTYGEERYARRIAQGILHARKAARIVGTLDLTAVIRTSVPANYERGRIHPATRMFQALRIAVNDELESLRLAIEGARAVLRPGGRIAVISFHSLEDRIVKHAFRDADDLDVVSKKPLIATPDELIRNPRARSAKLRIAQKTDTKLPYVKNVRTRHDAPA